MKQYTTKLQKNKNSLPLSPEVVAFQNSLPLMKGGGRQSPSRLLLEVGNPLPPSNPETLPFLLKAKDQLYPQRHRRTLSGRPLTTPSVGSYVEKGVVRT